MTVKICHIISDDLWAGAEAMVGHLLKGLKSIPELDVIVILLNRGRLSERLARLDIPVYIFDENIRSLPSIAIAAARVVRKHRSQIIHSHGYKQNIISFLTSIMARNNLALLSTQHGMPEVYNALPNKIQRIKSNLNYNLIVAKFDRIIAVSEDIKDLLIKNYGFQKQHIQVIRNGVDIPEAPTELKMKHDFVIGSAGRFFPVKDYPLMVKIAKEVIIRTEGIHFELAGEGPMRQHITKMITSYGLEDKFRLIGFLQNMDLFYRGLDVFLNTSFHEGIPMSVLEAMAYGIPAIVPKVGGLREIVTDSIDGYLVNTRNPIDFADKCELLYNNHSLYRNMSKAAREKIKEKFSVERMVQNYANLYHEIADESRC